MARKCRVCGCTDNRACLVLGIPCCWIEADLCSSCATLSQLLASEDSGVPWVMTVLGEFCALQLLDETEPLEAEVAVSVCWRDEA